MLSETRKIRGNRKHENENQGRNNIQKKGAAASAGWVVFRTLSAFIFLFVGHTDASGRLRLPEDCFPLLLCAVASTQNERLLLSREKDGEERNGGSGSPMASECVLPFKRCRGFEYVETVTMTACSPLPQRSPESDISRGTRSP
ncbi:hypothetical protein MTO96_029490 [Rhipicephalus appendiculatus]